MFISYVKMFNAEFYYNVVFQSVNYSLTTRRKKHYRDDKVNYDWVRSSITNTDKNDQIKNRKCL